MKSVEYKFFLEVKPKMNMITRQKKAGYDTSQYNTWVTKIQNLKNQGAACELEALRVLLAFEKTPLAWRSKPGQTFAELLQDDKRLFPVSRWRAFKKATNELTTKVINDLGVQAACLIAAQEPRRRIPLISKAKAFRKKHGVDVTYQYITELLKRRRPKKLAGPSRIQLMKYIQILKEKLVEYNHPVPPEPWN